jgi:hypothetical protein
MRKCILETMDETDTRYPIAVIKSLVKIPGLKNSILLERPISRNPHTLYQLMEGDDSFNSPELYKIRWEVNLPKKNIGEMSLLLYNGNSGSHFIDLTSDELNSQLKNISPLDNCFYVSRFLSSEGLESSEPRNPEWNSPEKIQGWISYHNSLRNGGMD